MKEDCMVGVMLSFCNNRQLLSSCDRFIYLHEQLLWLNKLLFASLKWYFEFNKVSWMATLRYENSFGRITIMIFRLNFHECKKIGLNQSNSHWCHASWSRCYVIEKLLITVCVDNDVSVTVYRYIINDLRGNKKNASWRICLVSVLQYTDMKTFLRTYLCF